MVLARIADENLHPLQSHSTHYWQLWRRPLNSNSHFGILSQSGIHSTSRSLLHFSTLDANRPSGSQVSGSQMSRLPPGVNQHLDPFLIYYSDTSHPLASLGFLLPFADPSCCISVARFLSQHQNSGTPFWEVQRPGLGRFSRPRNKARLFRGSVVPMGRVALSPRKCNP